MYFGKEVSQFHIPQIIGVAPSMLFKYRFTGIDVDDMIYGDNDSTISER